MLGYCATGRLNKAMTPTNTVTIAITDAKIGRSMKTWESRPSGFCRRGFGCLTAGHR